MVESFDYVVVGAGALGSAAAYRLAKAGATRVLVLEQFAIGHTKGASEDHSRLIRQSYNSEKYTCLAQPMYDAWAQVEQESGQQLVLKTGELELAEVGTPGETELETYRAAMAPGVTSERLDASEIRHRWPQWHIGDNVVGLYQEDGGILDIRRANSVHRALARGRGVEFRANTTVTRIDPAPSHLVVHTDRGRITAGKIVLCVASWSSRLFPSLGLDWPITLSQEQVSYFQPTKLRDFAPDCFPIWVWHGEEVFYGFPVYGEVATKVGRDMTGRFVTIDTRSYEPDETETRLLAQFLREHVPGALGPEVYSKTCVYDMPPDRDFILDVAPAHPRVIVGMGAGHVAKFASLAGQILAELATTGHSRYPIGPFRADRPALTDPHFTPAFRLAN